MIKINYIKDRYARRHYDLTFFNLVEVLEIDYFLNYTSIYYEKIYNIRLNSRPRIKLYNYLKVSEQKHFD